MAKINEKQLKEAIRWMKNYTDSKVNLEFNEDGNLLVTIGNITKEFTPGSGGSAIKYIVQYELNGCTLSNNATTVTHGDSYSTTISAESSSHTVNTVTVLMGGIDITNNVYDESTKTISIALVTGNISITISASAPVVGTIDSNSKEITLNNLPAGTYTLKYESDEGVIEGFDPIGTVEVQ